MKNDKGISLIALVVTIIAIIIISAIFVRLSTSSISLSEEAKISNERKEIESAITNRFADYAINKNAYPLVGKEVTISEISSIDGINTNDIEYIRKINQADIQGMSIKNTTGYEYIVDYLTGKVFGPIK